MSRERIKQAMEWAAETPLKMGTVEFEAGIKELLRGDVTVDGVSYRRADDWVSVPDYFVVAVNEFLSDWQKDDFKLESYALYDAQSVLEAKKRWAAELSLRSKATAEGS